MDEKQQELLDLQIQIEKQRLANELALAEQIKLDKQRIQENIDMEKKKEAERVAQIAAEKKAKEDKEKAQKEAEEKERKERQEWLDAQPDKCYTRTVTLPDGKVAKVYHSICDKKDYTRADKPDNVLGLLTGKYIREELEIEKIKEIKDGVHFIEKKK